MTNTNKRYDPVTTVFCGVNFQSVRVEGIDYYPVSLLPKDPDGINGFPILQNSASNDLKRLLGERFQSAKVYTSIHPKKVVCLDHDTLVEVIDEYAFEKQSKFCRLLLKASVGTQLKMANDFSRGQAEEVQYYIELQELRAAGIRYRRLFTDLVKMQKELGYELNYGYLTLLVYQSSDLIEKYTAWKEVYQTNVERNRHPFRGTLNKLELKKLSEFESNAANHAIAKKIPIIQAIKDTADFFG